MSPGLKKTQDEADTAEPIILSDGTIVQPQVAKQVVIFETFCSLWKKDSPHLCVRARGEDTCTNCFKIRNRMCFLLNKKALAEKNLNTISNSTPQIPKKQP